MCKMFSFEQDMAIRVALWVYLYRKTISEVLRRVNQFPALVLEMYRAL